MIIYDTAVQAILIYFDGEDIHRQVKAARAFTGLWLCDDGKIEPSVLSGDYIRDGLKSGQLVEIPTDGFIKCCKRTFGKDY